MKIIIPFKTPSVNHLYFNWKNRRILTKEARTMKKIIAEIVKPLGTIYIKEMKLKVSVEIFENWYLLDGETIAKKDISNREKFLIDSIFESLGIDDRYIFEHSMKKIQSEEEEKSEVTIDVL